MGYQALDYLLVGAYLVGTLLIGLWHGKGRRGSSGQYFISKGMLPWWAIGASYVATGMNTEQLMGQNGMGYMIGLPMVNWYMIAIFVYSALIFIFFPVYRRNNIVTMPEYLERRFNTLSGNLFTILLLLSYIFMSLAVVFYGGAKLLEIVLGWNMWVGLLVLAFFTGAYTLYGESSSVVFTSAIQFLLIFVSGITVFVIAYLKLPNGVEDQRSGRARDF